jgi:multidrug efflux pump subunit AcrA (membrane-fusion protein)
VLDDQRTLLIVALVAIAGLELWRRALRPRAPRWVHVAAIALGAGAGASAAYAQWQLSRTATLVTTSDASEKSTVLARGIARAMNANAFAISGLILAALVLGVGTYVARRRPAPGDLPVARAR